VPSAAGAGVPLKFLLVIVRWLRLTALYVVLATQTDQRYELLAYLATGRPSSPLRRCVMVAGLTACGICALSLALAYR
jgi:hypothetical protein